MGWSGFNVARDATKYLTSAIRAEDLYVRVVSLRGGMKTSIFSFRRTACRL